MSAADALLLLDRITVSFDGFKALNALSLEVKPGEMRAIIGPNGAGKTTMMDVITGKTRPDTGQAWFEGRHNLLNLDETQIAQLGIGRKFQRPTVFENLTVLENLELALSGPKSVFGVLTGRKQVGDRDRLDEILTRIRLTDRQLESAGALSHGQKQWLEIGMLLAQDPKVLLVDEPVAGMTDSETEETANLLRRIAKDHSVIVVEHDMTFVRSLDTVSANEQVIESYLGR